MPDHEASRTLVKSAPELWAECSEAASLGRHLGGFGEIRITKLEPETAVAWEGEDARGTVTLEPSGWGTRVTLTATAGSPAVTEPVVVEPVAAAGPEPAAAGPEPAAAGPEPAAAGPEPPGGLWTRLRARWGRGRAVPADVAPPPGPVPVPVPVPVHETGAPEPEQEPEPESEPETAAGPQPEPELRVPATLEDELALLTRALDSLGQAHRRPFSRG
jgi:hypothetical protein